MGLGRFGVVAICVVVLAGCGTKDGVHPAGGTGSGGARPLTEAVLLRAGEYGLAHGGRRTESVAGSRASIRSTLLRRGMSRRTVDEGLERLFRVEAGDAHCTSVHARPVGAAVASVEPNTGGGSADQTVYRFSSDASAERAFEVLTTICRYPVKRYRSCRSGDDCAWGVDGDGLESVVVRVGPTVTGLERVDVDTNEPIQRLAPRLAARLA